MADPEPTSTPDDATGANGPAAALAPLDPDVALLADVPVAVPGDDLLGHTRVAVRLVELACAPPMASARVVGLVGAPGSGKTSIINMAGTMLDARDDAARVTIDAGDNPSAESVLAEMLHHLQAFFAQAGLVDTSDRIRDTLAGYADFASSVARIAGVKVDVAGALRRSPEKMRAEIAAMTQEIGKRVVIFIDHIDHLPIREVRAAFDALRFYGAIPHVSAVLAFDRRTLVERAERERLDCGHQRLVQVELGVPAADRVLLARVVAGGLARVAAHVGRDVDEVLPLFDPDAEDGGPALVLCETPRDAKRVVNALTAALPLVPADADLRDACLEAVIRLLVPELDGPRLDPRWRATSAAARAQLLAELEQLVAGHPRAAAAKVALISLFSPGD